MVVMGDHTPSSDIEHRLGVLEAAVFRLTAEVGRLRYQLASQTTKKPTQPSPGQARRQVVEGLRQAIEAGDGQATLTTQLLAKKVGIHQTHLAAIVQRLAADRIVMRFKF